MGDAAGESTDPLQPVAALEITFQLAPLQAFHEQRRALATLALFESAEPWTGGVGAGSRSTWPA